MSEAAARRIRAETTAETRGKLIAAARRAFAAEGFAAASMDELCAAAGLTRGALYHHFGSKEGLLEAVLLAIDAEVGAELDRIAAATPDPWDAFRACAAAYLARALEPEMQRLVLRDAPAVLGQRFRDLDAAQCLQTMTEVLATLIAAGRIRGSEPEALARLLNGAIMDAALWIAASPAPAATLARAQGALAAILDGLTAPGAAPAPTPPDAGAGATDGTDLGPG